IFGRLFFSIPSLARTVKTSRPFWFCLAGIMVWSSHRRSEKRRRGNPILREVASTSSQGFNDPKSLDKNPSVDLQEDKVAKQEEKAETTKTGPTRKERKVKRANEVF
ncbi:TMV resistance protein N, partial [Trifolium pratense]